MSKPLINVAIGLVFHSGKVLVGWREAKQHQGNKYEFPGGKVEQGETPIDACRREIHEETGLDIQNWHIFDFIEHEYDDVIVRLNLFHAVVHSNPNTLVKPWAWYDREELSKLNFPKANDDIIRRLNLPKYLKITPTLDALSIVENQLIYLRPEPVIDKDALIKSLNQLSSDQLNQLIVNIELWEDLSSEIQDQIKTIHYKQSQLMQLSSGEKITGKRILAACHDLDSVRHAENLGFDCVLLSPVLATHTHPDVMPLGWEKFAEIVEMIQIPVFALGGLTPEDIIKAQQHGAYGVAGVSSF